MMAKLKDVIGTVGENAACYASDAGRYARKLGRNTSALAHRVGPKRGGIALGILAAAIAVPFIVRFVRNRRDEEMLRADGEARAPRARRRGRVPHPADVAAMR